MFEIEINIMNNKFEEIKEDVNNGKLLLFAEAEVEELLIEANELRKSLKGKVEIRELNVLIKQLSQYLCDIQGLIEQGYSITL